MITHLKTQCMLLGIIILFASFHTHAQEATITVFNTDNPDGFTLLMLRDYCAGEHIFITDMDYNPATNSFTDITADIIIRYTVPAGGLTKGTVISIRNDTDPNDPMIVPTGSVTLIGSGTIFGFSGGEPLSVFKSDNANNPLAGNIEIFGYFHSGASCDPVPSADGDCPCSTDFVLIDYCAQSSSIDAAVYGGPRNNTTFAQFTNLSNWGTSGNSFALNTAPFTNLQFGTTPPPNSTYLETFDIPDKGILAGPCTGTSGTTCASTNFSGVNWTIEGPQLNVGSEPTAFGPANDFKTSGGVLTSTTGDIDVEVCWVSPLLDITAAGNNVGFTVDISYAGFDSGDYMDVEYSLNGGSYLVAQANLVGAGGHTINDPATGAQNGVGASGLSGNTLQIRVCPDFNSGTETFTLDNVCVPHNVSIIAGCADADPPTITCPGNQTRDIGSSCSYTIEDFTSLATNVTDDCPTTPTVTQSPTAGGSITTSGNTQVTLTATDGAGNMTDCNFNLIVEDTENPTAICNDFTVVLNASGQALISSAQLGSTSDNCTGTGVSASPAFVDCSNLGQVTSSIFISDNSGNIGSCTGTITVVDDISPTANCPSNITQSNDAGQCGANVNFTIPSPTDNCSATSSANPASGAFFNVGTTQVTVTATDNSGNTDICTFDVTVNDTEAPTANCPGTQTVNNTAGQCGENVSFTIPAPTDNCTGATSMVNPASGSFFNVGTTQVTVTATDGAANTGTCTFDVVVNDTEDPTANCPNTQTVDNTPGQCGANVNFTIPAPTDNCSGATSMANPASGTFFDVGTTQVTVTATDGAANTGTCTFDVVVNDTENPTINCPSDVNVNAPANQCFAAITFDDPTTDDNCPGETFSCSPVSGSSFNVGTTTVTCTVMDVAGNSVSCTFNVTVNDNTPPSATCPNDVTVSAAQGQCGATVTYASPLVSDACGIAPAGGIECMPASGTFFDVGSTAVNCTITDINGNSSSCSFNVIVTDDEDPVTNCQADITQANDAGQCGANVSFSFFSPTDNCPGTGQSATHGPGDFYPVGTTTVTVTATDASSNQDQCTFDITVNDTEDPNMACNDFTLPLMGSSATITEAQVDNNSTDNCAITNLSLDNNTFSCSTLGAQTVTLTGTDAAGNSSSCQATITVEDNNTPTAVCANPSVNLEDGGMASVAASFFDGGSSAVCGTVTFSADITEFDCDDVGNTVSVTLTVSAQTNNETATCTANVTVTDTNNECCAPANAVCNNTTVILDANGMGSIMPGDVGGGSTAECGVMSESVTPMDFDCDDIGNLVSVMYTIEDDKGASSSCTAMVTVEDNSPPTPVCKTTTIEIQPDGMYTLQESDVYDAIASDDNCSIDNVSFATATYDCDDAGQSFTVGITVTDAGGNMVSCNASITVAIGDDLPDGWTASSIGDAGTMGNSTNFDPCATTNTNGEFVITGGGNNATSSTTDNVAFAGQTICGDGTITAKVESVTPNGYGGLMIRETTDAGAKQAAVFSNLSSMLRHEVRYMTNGPKQASSFFKPNPFWLRLERQGSWLFAYYSTTGMPNSFQYVHAVMVPMQSCVEFGLASFTYLPGQQTDATFSNVVVTGTPAPGVEVPGITEEISSKLRQEISLYPNPTNNIVNLIFEEGLSKDANVILRNHLGQVIEKRQLRTGNYRTEWDVSQHADGLYIFEIRKGAQRADILRFIKGQ